MGAVHAPCLPSCFCSVKPTASSPQACGAPVLCRRCQPGPWQRGLEPGGAQRVGLEELTSFDCVPDHWTEITLIGAFWGFCRVGCFLIWLGVYLKSLRLGCFAPWFCSNTSIEFKMGIKTIQLILTVPVGCSFMGYRISPSNPYQRETLSSPLFPKWCGCFGNKMCFLHEQVLLSK